ncbi:MAG: hypothetical protein GYB31_07670 [Bacteroidetes bacterium]|nr:hypothetical protein [Bacteroidota bacterium]
MKDSSTYIRALQPIEEAFTLSNDKTALCVVCVLHLSHMPDVNHWRQALHKLQDRHLLLQAEIVKDAKGYFFQLAKNAPKISLRECLRTEPNQWKSEAEKEVNTPVDRKGPLMRCVLLREEDGSKGEMIVSFHHAIMDSASARLLLHEMLSLSGGLELPVLPAISEVHTVQQPAFAESMFRFAARQIKQEFQFRRKGIGAGIPKDSENGLVGLRLNAADSRGLKVKAGRAGIGLNSLLLAAISLAVLRVQHPEKNNGVSRLISFANLRKQEQGIVPESVLGCYISMVRHQLELHPEMSLQELAAVLKKAMYRSGRRGEVHRMSKLSKMLVSLVFKLKNQRLGMAAISFMGVLNLDRKYGEVSLKDVSTFITNNRFGPEFSAFGKILFGSIGLDFTYLKSETTAPEAHAMVLEVEQMLREFANSQ